MKTDGRIVVLHVLLADMVRDGMAMEKTSKRLTFVPPSTTTNERTSEPTWISSCL